MVEGILPVKLDKSRHYFVLFLFFGRHRNQDFSFMQFNPQTKSLYTSEGKLLKKLHCPLRKEWEDLKVLPERQSRLCEACCNKVVDTAFYSEEALVVLLREKPETCLKIELGQENIQIL